MICLLDPTWTRAPFCLPLIIWSLTPPIWRVSTKTRLGRNLMAEGCIFGTQKVKNWYTKNLLFPLRLETQAQTNASEMTLSNEVQEEKLKKIAAKHRIGRCTARSLCWSITIMSSPQACVPRFSTFILSWQRWVEVQNPDPEKKNELRAMEEFLRVKGIFRYWRWQRFHIMRK